MVEEEINLEIILAGRKMLGEKRRKKEAKKREKQIKIVTSY